MAATGEELALSKSGNDGCRNLAVRFRREEELKTASGSNRGSSSCFDVEVVKKRRAALDWRSSFRFRLCCSKRRRRFLRCCCRSKRRRRLTILYRREVSVEVRTIGRVANRSYFEGRERSRIDVNHRLSRDRINVTYRQSSRICIRHRSLCHEMCNRSARVSKGERRARRKQLTVQQTRDHRNSILPGAVYNA